MTKYLTTTKAKKLFTTLLLAVVMNLLTVEVHADQVKDYINGLIGKTIDVSGLYDNYGFVGQLVSVHYENGLVLRIKGIVQKTKSDPKFWESVVHRPDVITIKSPNSGNEAVAIDAIMSIPSPMLREYDGYDKETDYFVSQMIPINISEISVKAMILQRAGEEKNDILIQDGNHTEKFKALVKKLNL